MCQLFLGTDTGDHIARSSQLIKNAIRFVATGSRTGFYVALSEYYERSPPTTVKLLDQLGDFKIRGDGVVGCAQVAHILPPSHPVVAGLADADLSFWGCSVHSDFVSYPKRIEAVAIAADSTLTGPGVITWPNKSVGIPYILATKVGGPCTNCSPNPGENLCDLTTSCTLTDYGTMCLCRRDYKADAKDDNLRVHWRLKWSTPGHEHRVAVEPGVVCNTLCDSKNTGPAVCKEASVADCGLKQGYEGIVQQGLV